MEDACPLAAAAVASSFILCAWHELRAAGQCAGSALRYQLIQTPCLIAGETEWAGGFSGAAHEVGHRPG